MRILYSNQFLKDVRKLNKSQTLQLKERLDLFRAQPTHPILVNHRLKGKLKGICSINVSGDLRAIYRMAEDEGDLVIRFIRLGTHSQLYS